MLTAHWIPLKHGGGRVRMQPLTGPQMWDLARTGFDGDTIYRVFAEAQVEFESLPLMVGDELASSKDYKDHEIPAVIPLLMPSVVFETVQVASNLATLSEEERGNYLSQRTSSATPRSSAADSASAPEDGSPPASDTDSSSSDG